MPSELDPLLPQNDVSPEISGNGYNQKPRRTNEDQSHVGQPTGHDNDSREDSDLWNGSPFRNIVGIFILVVGIALLITWLTPGGLRVGREHPGSPASPNISARVDRILSEHPLIGKGDRSLAFNNVRF